MAAVSVILMKGVLEIPIHRVYSKHKDQQVVVKAFRRPISMSDRVGIVDKGTGKKDSMGAHTWRPC